MADVAAHRLLPRLQKSGALRPSEDFKQPVESSRTDCNKPRFRERSASHKIPAWPLYTRVWIKIVSVGVRSDDRHDCLTISTERHQQCNTITTLVIALHTISSNMCDFELLITHEIWGSQVLSDEPSVSICLFKILILHCSLADQPEGSHLGSRAGPRAS